MTWLTQKRASELPPDWEGIRRDVLIDARWRCEIENPGCLWKATEVDHKHRGNDHRRSNLQAACRSCHGKKSSAEGVAQRRVNRARRKRPPERHPGSL